MNKTLTSSPLYMLALTLTLILTPLALMALDYYTIQNKHNKKENYLYSPTIKNHFLSTHDIKNLNKLILNLKKPNNPISSFIKNKLTENTKNLINKYKPNNKLNENIKLNLIKDINNIIKKTNIYSNKKIIEPLKLSKINLKLIKEKKDPSMLNRLIINEAFKQEINGWIIEKNKNKTIWKRNIKKNENPYKYLKQNNKIQYINKKQNLTFSVEKNNKKNTWNFNISGQIYLRPTGTFYQLHSNQHKEKQNKIINLNIKGNKINNRIYLNLNITTKNNNVSSSINGNIHLKITKNGLIEKDSFFAFARTKKIHSQEYIRIKGKIKGSTQNTNISAKLINVNGKEIGQINGNISLEKLLLNLK